VAERAVEQRIRLRERRDRERKVDQAEFLDDAGERRRRRRRHFLDAALQRGLLLKLVAEGRGRVLLNLHLAAALRGDELGESLDAHAHRVVGVVEVAELDRPLLHVLREAGQRKAH
jgi:hypothetical protein